MLHPFTPFVTEELWGHLKRVSQEKGAGFSPQDGWAEALIISRWPSPRPVEGWEDQKIADFTRLQEVVRTIRNLRTEKKVVPGRKIEATIAAGSALESLRSQAASLAALAYLDPDKLILVKEVPEKPQDQASAVVSGIEIYLPLAGMLDMEAERARLQNELTEVETQIQRLEELLNSPFADKAPAPVVEKERQKLATFRESAAKMRAQLDH